MDSNLSSALQIINNEYLKNYPLESAQTLESLSPDISAKIISESSIHIVIPVWQKISLDIQEMIIQSLPEYFIKELLTASEPAHTVQLLNRFDYYLSNKFINLLDPDIAKEIIQMLMYPANSAGQLMDTRIPIFRESITVQEAENKLQFYKSKNLKKLFLIDDEGHLSGQVEIIDLLITKPDKILLEISNPISIFVDDFTPKEEIVEKLELFKVSIMPVVSIDHRLLGVIRAGTLVQSLQEETSADIQTMVGVSKDERALSNVRFAVTKRLPWLHINLLTAFLAASVVGIFESTIAKYTALAVLLPVVAGQSGNSGAQALAVTMRGLALREISLRHWPKVVFKEVRVGLFNSLAIALTTSIGVFIWSKSSGLSLIIGVSMIISMIAAGFSGAIIPITLKRIGLDPAQSSSIILTTVTDLTGFFSFLGIASLLSFLL